MTKKKKKKKEKKQTCQGHNNYHGWGNFVKKNPKTFVHCSLCVFSLKFGEIEF